MVLKMQQPFSYLTIIHTSNSHLHREQTFIHVPVTYVCLSLVIAEELSALVDLLSVAKAFVVIFAVINKDSTSVVIR